MKFVALIPLRGGSKSIPKKNIKVIAGKPLCAWVLEAATSSRRIDSVCVSTDCAEIAQVVDQLGLCVEVIARPSELASDQASTESVMLHVMAQVDFDVLITIQATSPLLRASELDAAIEKFEAEKLDSLLSVVNTKRFFWNADGTPMNYDPRNRPRRQEFGGVYMENGAFYITRREILDRYRCRLGGHIGLFAMSEDSAHEVDEPIDWLQVEEALRKRVQ